MSNELTTVPAQVVVAKRNKEKLASIGVTEEKVFYTLRRALSAFKTQTVGRAKQGEDTPKRKEKRVADWPTRLKAIELYITLTSLSPEDVSKTLKGVTIEVSNGETPLDSSFPSGYEIDSARAKGRSVLEMARAMANGVEPPEAIAAEEPLTMPEKTHLSLKEILERRKDSIGERERAGSGKNGFVPSAPLRAEDL